MTRRRALLAGPALALALALCACETGPTKEEIEQAKKTIDCTLDGDRILIRFEDGEARLLMPDATRVILYQVPAPTGVRYLNGAMELRGRGLDMELTREDRRRKLDCKQYEIPVKKKD